MCCIDYCFVLDAVAFLFRWFTWIDACWYFDVFLTWFVELVLGGVCV